MTSAMVMAAALIAQAGAVAMLDAELAASDSATAVLQRRCDAPIRALVAPVEWHEPTPGLRTRLKVGEADRIAFREVALVCGDRVLSRARNWYVVDRLSASMHAELAGDAPFGAVIRPLRPTRSVITRDYQPDAETVLHVRALVLDGEGRPLAEVSERYQRALLD